MKLKAHTHIYKITHTHIHTNTHTLHFTQFPIGKQNRNNASDFYLDELSIQSPEKPRRSSLIEKTTFFRFKKEHFQKR